MHLSSVLRPCRQSVVQLTVCPTWPFGSPPLRFPSVIGFASAKAVVAAANLALISVAAVFAFLKARLRRKNSVSNLIRRVPPC